MTLTRNNFDDPIPIASTTDSLDESSGWEALYCSHLWSNSELRRAYINAPHKESKIIKYCYTCKGKIRKYELKSSIDSFLPDNHSTPNGKFTIEVTDPPGESLDSTVPGCYSGTVYSCNRNSLNGNDTIDVDVDIKQCIPSISHQIDSSFRHKYKSYEMRPNNRYRQRRLRKSLKGIGCIVNFALTDSPVKKRTQIQACSISVMIIAIVVISFILVNFTTPNFTRASTVVSTIVVPTKQFDLNETSSAATIMDSDHSSKLENHTTEYITTQEPFSTIVTETTSLLYNVLSKIRKNIKTYPKHSSINKESVKTKEIINRDLSQRFCSCQKDEVCMLDENSGTAVCRKSIDAEDPTGCGGLCALDTEACQLVDRARGVRVCRLLTLVTCSPQEWRCRNGLCVPVDARCDGIIQCYDRSDEMHCECDLTKQFRCGHSISCFPKAKLCNGVIDCWDGYDEVNCTTECPETQFTCTDGECILSSRFCDGLADCSDRSDEPFGCDGDCGVHEMRCNNRRCISRTVICDGHDNCGDETDELHCSK